MHRSGCNILFKSVLMRHTDTDDMNFIPPETQQGRSQFFYSTGKGPWGILSARYSFSQSGSFYCQAGVDAYGFWLECNGPADIILKITRFIPRQAGQQLNTQRNAAFTYYIAGFNPGLRE